MLADAESYAGRLPYEATCGLVIFVRLGLDYILIVVVATWATLGVLRPRRCSRDVDRENDEASPPTRPPRPAAPERKARWEA